MKALDFPILTDENVHPEIIEFLRKAGLDIDSIAEQGKFGLSDAEILRQATQSGRVVLTHDSDFGGLALMGLNLLESSIFGRDIFERTLRKSIGSNTG